MHEDSVAFIAIAMEEALSFFIISFRINKKRTKHMSHKHLSSYPFGVKKK